jgi:hypothetical protein
MNQYGVYALVGSTTSKISDQLDGIFSSIDFSTATVTAGQVLLNNILCAAFNIRYYDTSTSAYRYIQAVFFEKKWFFTSQGDSLKLITSVPSSGQIYLVGTDGTNFYQMYGNSTANISSTIQTALMSMTDPIRDKQALKVGIEATSANLSTVGLNVTIDSERSSSPAYVLATSVNWTNNSFAVVGWQNNSGNTVVWGTSGYTLLKTDAQQWGKYLGLTIDSSSSGFVIHGVEFEHELRARF